MSSKHLHHHLLVVREAGVCKHDTFRRRRASRAVLDERDICGLGKQAWRPCFHHAVRGWREPNGVLKSDTIKSISDKRTCRQHCFGPAIVRDVANVFARVFWCEEWHRDGNGAAIKAAKQGDDKIKARRISK